MFIGATEKCCSIESIITLPGNKSSSCIIKGMDCENDRVLCGKGSWLLNF